MTRRTVVIALTVLALMVLSVAPALAHGGHAHHLVPPNGNCHQVARGQTAADIGDGGYHRFHDNVHFRMGGSLGESDVSVAAGPCLTP